MLDLSAFHPGTQTLNWAIFALVIAHMASHTGEIGAIKGVQGLKGLPF